MRANQGCSHNVYGSFYLPGTRALLRVVLVNDKVDSIVKSTLSKAEKRYNFSKRSALTLFFLVMGRAGNNRMVCKQPEN